MALKYNCTVTVGYPEKVDVAPKWPTGPEYYNSVIVVNGEGETIANYRKSFLYYTDETWALEGNRGFYHGFIPGLGKTTIGICMDINPYKFQAPWHAFEFAFDILEMESNLVIVSMAWMTREDPRRFTRMPNEPDMETLTYWVTRLEPLIRSDNQDEIIVVFCNRTGSEDEALYAGTSAVIGVHDGEVKVYGLLGRGEKELLVVDTNNAPYAKLVYRPEAQGSGMEAPGHLEKPGDADDDDATEENKDSKHVSDKSSHGQRNNLGDGGSDAKQKNSQSSASSSLPLPQSLASDSRKRRQAPCSITIPKESDPVSSNPARSPASDSVNIPTPSAPSPTPMAIRPRLIIPESPPILPRQYPPDHPISAASLRSERSIRSIKSNESEASTQTVRSNPRPPEESTPYPHSGAPLSGYPPNSFSWIYGGEVTISSAEPFSPDTPFQDISPVSSRQYYWRPSDSLMRTPASAAGWTPGTPVGRRPEPFPWPAMTGNTRPPSRGGARDLGHLHLQSPQSNASSSRTARTVETTRSESSVSSKGTVQVCSSEDKPERPSSPKSRNASRSRMHDGGTEAISQHLEGISLRAESVNGLRAVSTSGRSSSPKPRNCSPQPANHTIHIAASPSILGNEGRNHHHQSSSRAARHQRSNSLTADRPRGTDSDGTRTPTSRFNASHAAGRGRTPGPKSSPDAVIPAAERASSADSTRNDRLHRRVHQPGSRTRTSLSSQNGRRRSDEGVSYEFERVEAIICPSCPVHGQPCSSGGTRNSEVSIPVGEVSMPVIRWPRQSSPTQRPASQSSPTQRPASQSSPTQRPASSGGPSRNLEPEQTEPRRTCSGDAGQLTLGDAPQLADKDTQPSSQNEAEASDCGSFTETLQTVSTSSRSPATPPLFDSSTPRAMLLDTDDAGGRLDGSGKTPTVRCASVDVKDGFDVGTSSVA
ncbi:hypothetical protein N0V84_012132 [Fusarium piperis]|uniref:CN hydrolase domain-containing protein n=1 Tax=Fusarium piperis TaxID=1435070 RepID=A0A9W8TAT7_9HYPO|nr:hypothetical protein N0V84_012132 [Fusarium piperis]